MKWIILLLLINYTEVYICGYFWDKYDCVLISEPVPIEIPDPTLWESE